ncbi:MAG: SRPBCC domain-containing protein [Saprospiraceae bacterium]
MINFKFSFQADQSAKEVFDTILNVRVWWSGLYAEEIEGTANKLNDEFIFKAGGGVHYSKQKLIELVPEHKVVWLVTDSNLSFLEKPNEWTNTKICFEINKADEKTNVLFTHRGLVPDFECYNGCSTAWSLYMQQFILHLKEQFKAQGQGV